MPVAHVGQRHLVSKKRGCTFDRRQGIGTQPAVVLGDEDQLRSHRWIGPQTAGTNVAYMRPTTAAVMIGLLLLILAAFVVKAQTSGFTP